MKLSKELIELRMENLEHDLAKVVAVNNYKSARIFKRQIRSLKKDLKEITRRM